MRVRMRVRVGVWATVRVRVRVRVFLPEPSRSMCLKMRYQDCLVGTGSILAICMLSRLESAATWLGIGARLWYG